VRFRRASNGDASKSVLSCIRKTAARISGHAFWRAETADDDIGMMTLCYPEERPSRGRLRVLAYKEGEASCISEYTLYLLSFRYSAESCICDVAF
jgi:hypothetical protein